MKKVPIILFLLPVLLMLCAAGCNKDNTRSSPIVPGDEREPDTTYHPQIDPESFTSAIDNSWLPMPAGYTYVYEGETEEGLEHIEVTFSADTRMVMGVECRVVRDKVWVDGEFVEDTWDWYAQDSQGNIWYFGEDSYDFEDGAWVLSSGSWEANVDGAQPGIYMHAVAEIGVDYRQEYYFNHAEDMARVLETNASATIGLGTYTDCRITLDWNPLEEGSEETKTYAPGVGQIRETIMETGDVIELIEIIER